MNVTNSEQFHTVQNQEDSAPNTTHNLVNNPQEIHLTQAQGHQLECTTQQKEGYTHTHTHQEQKPQ